MGKKHKNLFPQIVDTHNLYDAYRKARKGRQDSPEHLKFRQHLGENIRRLQDDLIAETYRPGAPRFFNVYEPKRRLISAMPFYDCVAEHAICNVLEPVFDRVFLPQSYACRRDKGTHAAARNVQAMLRRMTPQGQVYVLKTDFSKYFPSVVMPTLHREYQRKVSCGPTQRLLHAMLPVHEMGLGIGRLISQLSANLYGHIVDRWLVHTKGVLSFARYMDDIVVLSHSRAALSALKDELETFAHQHMGMRFSHWSIQSATRGINFVGYRIWAHYKLLRKQSVARAKRMLKHLTGEPRRQFLAAWLGHVKHADCYNLLKQLELA